MSVVALVPAVVVSALALAALGGGGWMLWRRGRRQRAREGGAWDWKMKHTSGAVGQPVALLVTDIQVCHLGSVGCLPAVPAA